MAGKITKMEMVRSAWRKLGPDATNAEVEAWIKNHYSVEVQRQCYAKAKEQVESEMIAKDAEEYEKDTEETPLLGVPAAANGRHVTYERTFDVADIGGKDQLRKLLDLL